MCTIAPENPIEFYQYRVVDTEGILGTANTEYDCIHFVTQDNTFQFITGDTSVAYPFSYEASKTRLATVAGFNDGSSIEIPVAIPSSSGISYRSQLIRLHSDSNNYRAIPECNTSNILGRIVPEAITNITGNYAFTLFMEVATDVYNYLNIKLYTPV